MSWILVAALASSRPAVAPPVWLTIPNCKGDAALSRHLPFMLPPRKLQETDFDSAGQSAAGRCLPYALLLQMQQLGCDVPSGRDLRTIDGFRNSVLEFASARAGDRWMSRCTQYGEFGDVVRAVAQLRGWVAPRTPNWLAMRAWTARIRAIPREECDAAFLFAAAACHGLRIHVHYVEEGRGLVVTRFATPTSASEAFRRPETDVHVGFVDNGDNSQHYVSLPPLWTSTASF